jgi:hypothetical protein
MDKSMVGAAVAVGVVVIVALLARRSSGAGEMPVPPANAGRDDGAAGADADGRETDAALEDDDAEAEQVEVVAVTSDGYALVPDTHAVRLVPPHEEGEAWKAGSTVRNVRGERALEMSWHNGDFTGGRVVHGAADEGPWRFEALGRDGEYAAFVFETRGGADAALALFQSRGVIRHGKDEDDNDAPPSAEQFEEARRIYLETEAALEGDDDESDA